MYCIFKMKIKRMSDTKRVRQKKSLGEQIAEREAQEPFHVEVTDDTLMISTGSTLLDLAISGSKRRGGGIPGGIMVVAYGPSGCVDCDTEFLSPDGWKKISEWDGDKVMQYNKDGTAEFVQPLEYIKEPAETLYHIKTKYGINQCLSENHNMFYTLPKRGTFHIKPMAQVKAQHEKAKYGFSGRFLTTFTPVIGTILELTDEELRVQVMFNADGSFNKTSESGAVNIKKKRKIKRAEKLLKDAGIDYTEHKAKKGYKRFYFKPPIRSRNYDYFYYKCSPLQLKVIIDEIFYWDGSISNKGQKSFHSTNKEDVGFIQYALAANGIRSSVYVDKRDGRNDSYSVHCAGNTLVSMTSNTKQNFVPYKTKDGFQYCFTVPSNLLVFRREGSIFVTGNSGKTVLACEVAGYIQRGGGAIKYRDTEARLDKGFASIFGIDFDEVDLSHPNTVQEAFLDLHKWDVESDVINGYIIDSLAALSTDLEMDSDEGDKMGMRRAKEFSENLRKSARLIKDRHMLLFCTNQIREDTDAIGMYVRRDKNPGGKAIEFYASLILRFSSFKKIRKIVRVGKRDVRRVVGIEGEIEVVKSSVCKPYRTAPIYIDFNYGIDDIRENLKFVKQYTGESVYFVNRHRLKNSLEESILMVEEQNLEQELKEQVIDLWEFIENKFVVERKEKVR